MKLHELHLLETPTFDPQSELDHRASNMKLPSIYDKHDFGKKSKLKLSKVVIRDTKTGKIYGAKSLYQKVI
jgi:hypothetical protein